jgi:hypothetical protein
MFVSRTWAFLQKHFGNHALAPLRLDRRKKIRARRNH